MNGAILGLFVNNLHTDGHFNFPLCSLLSAWGWVVERKGRLCVKYDHFSIIYAELSDFSIYFSALFEVISCSMEFLDLSWAERKKIRIA